MGVDKSEGACTACATVGRGGAEMLVPELYKAVLMGDKSKIGASARA
jgi:hypothetical protein